jgi:hypothetical protein
MKNRLTLLAALLLAPLAALHAASPSDADSSFDPRRQMSYDAVWTNYQATAAKPSAHMAFWRAEALFELGKIEEGRRLVNRGLDQLVPGNKENRWIHGGNSGFTAWPGLDCYIRYEPFLDDATKQRYREIYTGAVFYKRLSTSNHKIMAAVGRCLATQIWGADAFHPDPFFQGKEDDGAYFQKGDPTGEKYIRANLEEVVRSGPGEYASRPYGAENILPLLTLAECARDAELRRRAAIAYECSLLQLAPAYLRGHLATFAPRSYPDAETQRPWGVAAVLWAYFGGVAPERLHDQWALRTATAKYRLPESLQPIGTDRSVAYVHRALINRWALYHFVNKGYVLYSRSPKAVGKGFQGQSYPCGVMWEEPDTSKGSQLWITNPAADDNNADGNKTTAIHTHGVTAYEQEVQHRDALLFVFNIPADFRNPYVLGFVPGGYRASLTAPNRIFLHYGSVLIAVTSAHAFDWNPASGIRAPAGKPRAGDSEFRVQATQTALAIETALPTELSGATPAEQLAAFRDRLLAKTKIEFQTADKPVGRYTDRAGHTLECVFDGLDKIDGAAVDYTQWPVLESPWTRQLQPTGPLDVNIGHLIRRYDFTRWEISEKMQP